MIFDNDYTSLSGSTAIPMAEGYDCSYGTALALVESARNDIAMFNAMMGIEARNSAIMRESTGVIREGEIQALAESAVAGIWKKIKELFSKLVAKIKAIFHNFIAKISNLFMKDKDYVKKYETEVLRKTNIGKLEVKWRKINHKPSEGTEIIGAQKDAWTSIESGVAWDAESDTRLNNVYKNQYASFGANNFDDVEDEAMGYYFEDDEADTYKLDDIGGIRGIISYLKDSSKIIKNIESGVKNITADLSKCVDNANKKANETAKKSSDSYTGNDKASKDDVSDANHAYDMAVALQTVVLRVLGIAQDAVKIEYQQNKAAFVKAVAANDKKLEENALYLDYVAEAAADEVEEVIQGAIDGNSVDVGSSNLAPTNLTDGSVSNDPDENVADYGKNSNKYNKGKIDGSVDTDYNGKESAFFGQLFY